MEFWICTKLFPMNVAAFIVAAMNILHIIECSSPESAMGCYTYLRNVTDLLSDGKTPCERRFGQPFKGPIIPFGSLVDYHPKTAKDQSRIHQFGKEVVPGLFPGYAPYAGRSWKGDVLVADVEELETMDASDIYSERLNAKKVINPKNMEIFTSPAADGRNTLSGNNQELRISTFDAGTSDSRRRSRRFSWRIRRVSLPPLHDSFPASGEAMNDFWSMPGTFIFRHHVEPRVKLHSPWKEWFLVPLKTLTSPELRIQTWVICMNAASTSLEHRCVIRFVWFLDRFSLSLLFWNKPPDGSLGSGRDWLSMARTLDEIGKGCPAEGEAKVVTRQAETQSGQKITRNLIHWSWGQGIHRNHQECSQEIGNANGSCHALQDMQDQSAWCDPLWIQWDQIKTCVYFGCQWTHKTACGNHHEDHILQEKGTNSLQHYNLVHKLIPMPQALKIPAGKAAVDKEWRKIGENFGVERDERQ